MTSRFSIRKYGGDDRYSWALFLGGVPVMTGMDRTEARWRLREAREREQQNTEREPKEDRDAVSRGT